MFSDNQAGANANMVVYIMVEMAKAHELHPYSYLKYLLDSRPSTDTSETELADLTPWSDKARIACGSKSE
ncbi:transposase domain-containing protein [Hungatella effluvii]|uniref:transposase domain-containing protein n=1 Tax=Hungatella effluvii TaxID=1096246 RepID=UPI003D80E2D7